MSTISLCNWQLQVSVNKRLIDISINWIVCYILVLWFSGKHSGNVSLGVHKKIWSHWSEIFKLRYQDTIVWRIEGGKKRPSWAILARRANVGFKLLTCAFAQLYKRCAIIQSSRGRTLLNRRSSTFSLVFSFRRFPSALALTQWSHSLFEGEYHHFNLVGLKSIMWKLKRPARARFHFCTRASARRLLDGSLNTLQE